MLFRSFFFFLSYRRPWSIKYFFINNIFFFMAASDRLQLREEQHKEEKKRKKRRKKNSFSKLCRETRSYFFLLLVSLPKLFLGTNFCKNVPGNKKFTKRISVPKLFLGTKEQKFLLFGTLSCAPLYAL